MKLYGVIYGLLSPSYKWYIGQTTRDIDKYITIEYRNKKGQSRPKLATAIRKYGFDSFLIVVLQYCYSKAELDNQEISLIHDYDSVKHGYNLQYGGSGGKHSDEIREKISKARTGMKLSDTHKNNIKKAYLNRTEEHKMKMHIHNISKRSTETKEKIKAARAKQVLSEDYKDNIAFAMGGKPFIVFKDNQYIGTWINQSRCERDLREKRLHITDCLRGLTKTSHGYTFKYMVEGEHYSKANSLESKDEI